MYICILPITIVLLFLILKRVWKIKKSKLIGSYICEYGAYVKDSDLCKMCPLNYIPNSEINNCEACPSKTKAYRNKCI
jgi:hypothetical protein